GFRQRGEGRHAGGGIAVADLPKQGAIALRLHFWGTQVGGPGILAAAVLLMAAHAGAHVELAPDSSSVRVLGLRIGLGRRVGGRFPLISRRLRGLRDSQASQAGEGKYRDREWPVVHLQWLPKNLRSLLRKPRIS